MSAPLRLSASVAQPLYKTRDGRSPMNSDDATQPRGERPLEQLSHMLRRLSRAISLPQTKSSTEQRGKSPAPKRSASFLPGKKVAVLIERSTQSVPTTAEAAIQAGSQGEFGAAPGAARQLFSGASAELGGDSGRHSQGVPRCRVLV